jgi:hypothetical protein
MATTNSIEQHTQDLETQRFQLEREKFEAEQNDKKRNWWTSPLLVTVAVGVFGLLGNAAALFINGAEQLQLAREKQQGDLVLELIKTGNTELAKQNLLLLANTGLLDDKTAAKIQNALLHQGLSPALPAAAGQSAQLAAGHVVYIQYAEPAAEGAVTQLQSDLARREFYAPAIEKKDPGEFDSGNVVRYFRPEDGPAAEALRQATNESLARNCPNGPKVDKLDLVPAQSSQLEVWIQSCLAGK